MDLKNGVCTSAQYEAVGVREEWESLNLQLLMLFNLYAAGVLGVNSEETCNLADCRHLSYHYHIN